MKRRLALALAAAGLLALAVRAVRDEPPLGASISILRRFWTANEPTRLLNSSMFVKDRELGVALMKADREWPLAWDARLVVAENVPPPVAQQQLEKSAYVLAPRRVLFARGPTAPGRFRLEALVKAP